MPRSTAPLILRPFLGHDIEIPIASYPDRMPYVRLSSDQIKEIRRAGNTGGETPVLIIRTAGLADFMAALFFIEAMRARNIRIEKVTIPLFPGSRQDRLLPDGDALFTLKSIAGSVNLLGLHVLTLDPHSLVTPALLDRCTTFSAADILRVGAPKRYAKPDFIIAPDLGAVKRASEVAAMWEIPLLQAFKDRDPVTGKLTGFRVASNAADFAGKRGLVVDDICDGGGTFLGLADELQFHGINAELYVTHGLFSKGTEDLLKVYDRIITTNSVIYPHLPEQPITVIPVV